MKAVLPGATIGILGSGQLGRMFAISARRLGYRVHTLSPDTDTPAGQISDCEITAGYHDLDAVRDFARRVDVVTFEFENVPAATAAEVERFAPVRPAGNVLHVAQHRVREKTFLRDAGFPVAPFRVVRNHAELQQAVAAIGCPAVLKTAGFGYDGHGQAMIRHPEDADSAYRKIGSCEAVLEGFIDFACEVSVVAARGADGSFAHYGVVENRHRHHILDSTIAPAPHAPEAVEIARAIMEKLEVAGVLAVEFFVRRDGGLIVNELAPRPHNSGHFTIDACVTSQFEQQLRAVCGLPLGSTEQVRPAAMVNLLGDLWNGSAPDWAAACALPGVKLHLYGKSEPRPGRKMGHITALGPDPQTALDRALQARDALTAR
ncbi:MAG: 5-(carboxyamino)imidazole ribonucleotide synthase [Acidobacteria bacterium]|nr:5-(carboxyamino)imidazole ribonucleotide synthase [Acidobacteriota bacterium]